MLPYVLAERLLRLLLLIHTSHLSSFVFVFSLLGKDRSASLNAEQRVFARDTDNGLSLIDVVNKYKPDILLGVTAVGGLFTEDLITELAAGCVKPIIFPLSNPSTKADCTARQFHVWTAGSFHLPSCPPCG